MAHFYLDHNVAIATTLELRERGHQCETTRGLHLERARDSQQLLVAAQLGAILVTHNKKDFILLNDAWNRWAPAWGVAPRHAGILVCPAGVWSAPRLAQELSDFLLGGYPLPNSLYTWNRQGGWVRA